MKKPATPSMAQAYKKAVSAKQPSPEESDPGMLPPKKPGALPKPKDKGMLPPKSGKPSTKPRRTGKEM